MVKCCFQWCVLEDVEVLWSQRRTATVFLWIDIGSLGNGSMILLISLINNFKSISPTGNQICNLLLNLSGGRQRLLLLLCHDDEILCSIKEYKVANLWLRCSHDELQYNCGGKLSGGDKKERGVRMRKNDGTTRLPDAKEWRTAR